MIDNLCSMILFIWTSLEMGMTRVVLGTYVSLLHEALALCGVEPVGGLQELVLKGILVDLEVRQHPQQALEELAVHGLADALSLDQEQQAVHRARLNHLVTDDVYSKQI